MVWLHLHFNFINSIQMQSSLGLHLYIYGDIQVLFYVCVDDLPVISKLQLQLVFL